MIKKENKMIKKENKMIKKENKNIKYFAMILILHCYKQNI
jgi:hypothetical protein